jgi:hypothetical protein
MNTEKRLWQVATCLVMLLNVFVPAYVAYDLYGHGAAPQKQLQLIRFPLIEPMKDLSILRERVSLSVKAEDLNSLVNLVIAKAFLRNV